MAPSFYIAGGNRDWARRNRGELIVAGECLLLLAVTGVWGVPTFFLDRPAPPAGVGASCAILVGLLTTMFWLSGIRAVALQTFAQCLRMKMAAVFILLLAAVLALMPMIMTGDGTLAGRIKTLLSYGTSATALLLSLVTILLATSVVSSDIRKKQIFITATKPLARWQYLLGRWLGVLMLDAVLLALAAGAIYALAQYLRGRHDEINGEDRRAVETEVFAARRKIGPVPKDLDANVRDRIDALKAHGQYNEAVDSWKARLGSGDTAAAEAKLLEQIRSDVTEGAWSVGPGGGMSWLFTGVRAAGGTQQWQGIVEDFDPDAQTMRVAGPPGLLRKLVYQTPVRVEGVGGRATEIGPSWFTVQFYAGSMKRLSTADLKGRRVSVIVDPTIQFTYKAVATGDLPNDCLPSLWAIEDPVTHVAPHLEERLDPIGRPATLTASALVVNSNGAVMLMFTNLSKTSVRIPDNEVSLLFTEGTFEWNFFRGALLILLQLAFLAAIGVFAGSFVSFQVACLLCLTALPFCLGSSFLTEAINASAATSDVIGIAGHFVLKGMCVVVPDFTLTWPSTSLVDGIYMSWAYVGQVAAMSIGLRSMMLLALACAIFRKRELARVQAQ